MQINRLIKKKKEDNIKNGKKKNQLNSISYSSFKYKIEKNKIPIEKKNHTQNFYTYLLFIANSDFMRQTYTAKRPMLSTLKVIAS